MRLSKPKAFFLSLIFPIAYLLIQVAVSGAAGAILSFAAGVRGAVSGNMEQAIEGAVKSVSNGALIISGVASAITIASVYLWLIGAKKNVKAELNLKRPDWLTIPVALILGAAANTMISGLLSLLPLPQGLLEQYSESVGEMLTSGGPVESILCVGILGPVAEEYAFRGMCMGTLRKGYKAITAVLLSSVIFALAHLVPLQMAYVLPIALLLSFTFLWADSLYTAIAMHIGFNMTSAVADLLTRGAAEELPAEAAFSWETLLMMLAGTLVTAGCMYLLWRRRRASASDLPPAREGFDGQPA